MGAPNETTPSETSEISQENDFEPSFYGYRTGLEPKGLYPVFEDSNPSRSIGIYPATVRVLR
jgi:hypothetical protein